MSIHLECDFHRFPNIRHKTAQKSESAVVPDGGMPLVPGFLLHPRLKGGFMDQDRSALGHRQAKEGNEHEKEGNEHLKWGMNTASG